MYYFNRNADNTTAVVHSPQQEQTVSLPHVGRSPSFFIICTCHDLAAVLTAECYFRVTVEPVL